MSISTMDGGALGLHLNPEPELEPERTPEPEPKPELEPTPTDIVESRSPSPTTTSQSTDSPTHSPPKPSYLSLPDNNWRILYGWELDSLRQWETHLERLGEQMIPLQEKIRRLQQDEDELCGQCGIDPPNRSKHGSSRSAQKSRRKKRDIIWGEFGEWFSFVSDQISEFQAEMDALEREKQKAEVGIRRTKMRLEKIKSLNDDGWLDGTLAESSSPPLKLSQSARLPASASLSSEETKMKLQTLTTYQERWAYLQSSSSKAVVLSFETIPWPLSSPPDAPSSISRESVGAFLSSASSSSEADGNEKSQRSALRNAVFLWHPDNFLPKFLGRVEEAERSLVLEGVQNVIESLDEIMHSLLVSTEASSYALKAS